MRRRCSWRETKINPTDFGRAGRYKRMYPGRGGGGAKRMPEANHAEASCANFEWPNHQVRAAKSIHRVSLPAPGVDG